MFLEELIEQHGIDRFVADGLWFSLLVARDQLRADFSHLLGDQTKRERLRRIGIFLVTEGDRFERKESFAAAVHRLDVMLEPARRGKCADLVVGIDVNRAAIGDRGVNIANARGVAFTCDAGNARADADIAAAGGESDARSCAYGNVVRSGGVGEEGSWASGRVEVSNGVVVEHENTVGRVEGAGGVAVERLITVGHVVGAGSVGRERIKTAGCVVVAGGVAEERISTAGHVGAAGGVAEERVVPLAVLALPVVLLKSAFVPLAVLVLPVVLLRSA